jgi:hypothetical protein
VVAASKARVLCFAEHVANLIGGLLRPRRNHVAAVVTRRAFRAWGHTGSVNQAASHPASFLVTSVGEIAEYDDHGAGRSSISSPFLEGLREIDTKLGDIDTKRTSSSVKMSY